jgi:hypothetical protein
VSPFNRKPEDLESDLQSDIIDFAHIRGWFAVKIVSPSRRGMMDIYCLRRGRHVWMEVKRLGEEARPQQERVARDLRAQQAEVYVVDSLDRAREILR